LHPPSKSGNRRAGLIVLGSYPFGSIKKPLERAFQKGEGPRGEEISLKSGSKARPRKKGADFYIPQNRKELIGEETNQFPRAEKAYHGKKGCPKGEKL